MPIPEFDENGRLPEGRHVGTLDELEAAFVLDVRFLGSDTRRDNFADLLATLQLLGGLADNLVERIWVGGSFVSAKIDPSDVDVTFILNADAHEPLSGRKKDKIARFGKDGLEKFNLKVDASFFVRERIINPWSAGGIAEGARSYMADRGVWDDWWSRERLAGDHRHESLVNSSNLVRGYVEVIISGSVAAV